MSAENKNAPDEKNYHLSVEAFRRDAYAAVDWLCAYMENVEQYPVLSQAQPGELRAALPASPPKKGEGFDVVLKDLTDKIVPGLTHWQSPNFFAFFPANNSGPSVIAELLCAGLGVQGMLWATSPACTELESHVLDWLVELLGLPPCFLSSGAGGGVIQDSASSATLCALLAARERASNGRANLEGTRDALAVYASSQTHSSLDKAVGIVGMGKENLRHIAVDADFAMSAQALRDAIQTDIAAGVKPAFISATIGTTSSCAVDPISAVAEIAREYDIWLHVDAAMAGSAAVCPEHRHWHTGLEQADSYCFNPHKWLFTNFDCDCFYVADRDALIRALTILPEYLRNDATDSGEVIDYRDWQVPLGRRFRALKLWFVIRHYGVEGLQHHIREHINLTQKLAANIETHPDFLLLEAPRFNLICFRHVNGDEFSRELLSQLNESGQVYLTHTQLNDTYYLRFCIGQTTSEARHVDAAWQLIQDTAKYLAA